MLLWLCPSDAVVAVPAPDAVVAVFAPDPHVVVPKVDFSDLSSLDSVMTIFGQARAPRLDFSDQSSLDSVMSIF